MTIQRKQIKVNTTNYNQAAAILTNHFNQKKLSKDESPYSYLNFSKVVKSSEKKKRL